MFKNMTTPEIIGQIIGFAAMAWSAMIPQQKTRTRILITKMCTDVLWILHWMLLGGWTAMAITVVACFRSIVFFILEKKGKDRAYYWLAIFLCTSVISVLITWNHWWSILSMFSSIVATLAYWQKDTNRTKIMLFSVSCSQLTYAIINRSYSVILNEILTMVSLLIFLIRVLQEKKRAEAAPADPK